MRKRKQISLMDGYSLKEKILNAAKTATKYITSIDDDTGVRVHAADDTQNYTQLDSDGMKVYKGDAEVASFGSEARVGYANSGNLLARSNGIAVRDGLEELSRFGADGMQVGKDGEQHIAITPSKFEVYDEDGSNPFTVTTASSLQSKTTQYLSSVTGGSGNANTLTIYLIGTVTDDRYYVDTSASGAPTGFTQYFSSPTSSWSNAITINGVEIRIRKAAERTIQVRFVNTVASARYIGVQITQSYRETTVKVNDTLLKPEYKAVALVDSAGTSQRAYIATYGKVAMLYFQVYRSSVAVGGVLYEGTLLDYVPITTTSLVGEFSGKVMYGELSSTGHIIIYNTGTQTISPTSSHFVAVTATYIMQ